MSVVLIPVTSQESEVVRPLDLDQVVGVTIFSPREGPGQAIVFVQQEDEIERIDVPDSYRAVSNLMDWAGQHLERVSAITDQGPLDSGAAGFVDRERVTRYEFVRPDDAPSYWTLFVGPHAVGAERVGFDDPVKERIAESWK